MIDTFLTGLYFGTGFFLSPIVLILFIIVFLLLVAGLSQFISTILKGVVNIFSQEEKDKK